jgi:hypothetical protein
MPFNIATFKTTISGNGYLPSNKFQVFVTPPPILQNSSVNNLGTPELISNIARDLSFRIDQVKTPGITLLNADVNLYGIGPSQKQPMNAQFGENSFSILSDGYGYIWQFWHNWVRNVFEFTGTSSARVGTASKVPTYTSNYKSEYASTMQIVMYDMFGNAIQKINMFEAFPVAIRENSLNWGDNGNLIRLNISIAYSEYNIEGTEIENQNNQQQGFPGGAQRDGARIIAP